VADQGVRSPTLTATSHVETAVRVDVLLRAQLGIVIGAFGPPEAAPTAEHPAWSDRGPRNRGRVPVGCAWLTRRRAPRTCRVQVRRLRVRLGGRGASRRCCSSSAAHRAGRWRAGHSKGVDGRSRRLSSVPSFPRALVLTAPRRTGFSRSRARRNPSRSELVGVCPPQRS
jgi:hypothetical protein